MKRSIAEAMLMATRLRSIMLLLVVGFAAVGISMAGTTVSTSGTVISTMTWTPPTGVAMPPLDPSVSQPITAGDSFVAGCNGPFEVTATALGDANLAANGKMCEWDTVGFFFKVDGHQLGTPMHLVGTGPNSFGDKNLQAIIVKLVESEGQAPITYNFDWSQTVLWSDYPETPYNLKVEFALNRIFT